MRGAGRWLFVPSVALLALVASSALGASTVVKTRAAVAASASQTFTVNVDGANKAANESFIAYYPNVVRVHAGDTVVFHYVGVGEPHTVTLGTLTDAAVSAFDKLTPAQQNNPPKSAVAVDSKLPNVFPNGNGDVIPSAANPCFLSGGVPSAKAACAKTAQPDFTGTQSFYNSGWLAANAKFIVHLSSATPPGIYKFMCLIHRESMSGKITVVARSTAVPSPNAQAALGQGQLAAAEAPLVPVVAATRQGIQAVAAARHVKLPASVTPPGSTVVLAGGPGVNGAGIDEFGPRMIKIPVGGSVIWYFLGLHSITFNATKANNDVRAVAPDGSVHLNIKAVAPAGGPGEPSKPPTGGSKGRPNFRVVAVSSWNGTGFHNSGVFGNSPSNGNFEGYKLTFTHAGTYKFICTVHDKMKGTVVVG